MQKIVFAILSLIIHAVVAAQSLTVEQYIETYKDIAIREMKRMGIPASITLAQGILETESGNSDLVKRSNNHFGIKCKSTWSGNSVFHDDDEQGECFRKYNTAAESFRDHSNFLRGNDRYAFLFKLAPTDYKGWAYGLKKAGYATNPQYPNILIKNIEQYNLQQYSAEAAGEVPLFDTGKYTDDKNQQETIAIAPATDDKSKGSEMTVSSVKSGKTQFNGVKAVFATKETSLLAIATEHEIALSKLLEFNDLKTDGLLKADGWIFLEKKLKQGNRDFYTTQNDENVYDIAQVNAVQLSNLLAYNNLEEDELVKAGTKILLRPAELKGVKELVVNEKMHEVQPKEGLYAISKKYHVSIEDLKAWNNLASDDLRVGQKLIISK